MYQLVRNIWNFIGFACTYNLLKCIRTMLAGTAVMIPVLLFRKCNKKHANVNFHVGLFIIPMAFMGMNKIFFNPGLLRFSNVIYGGIKPVYGKMYFLVAAILLVIFICRNHKAAAWVRGLPRLQENETVTVTGKYGFISGYCLRHVRVYVTEERMSPFSGGIVKPYIVVPRFMLEQCGREELYTVVCHELTHIASGHIVWMALFRLLRIYWWINPLMYLMEKRMLEDMELVCDEKCVWSMGLDSYSYGQMLLMVAKHLQTKTEGHQAAFLGKCDYALLRKRILYLDKTANRKFCCKMMKIQTVIFAVLFCLLLAGVKASSYPRYTELEDIYLYDAQLNLRVTNLAEMEQAVSVRDGKLMIDDEAFRRLLDYYRIEGDYVYISYGTIMKVPGCGGGGNIGMVFTQDSEDIVYLSADTFENKFYIFCLKYLM